MATRYRYRVTSEVWPWDRSDETHTTLTEARKELRELQSDAKAGLINVGEKTPEFYIIRSTPWTAL